MRLYFPDTPDVPLPPGHRFPAGKYRALRYRLEAEGIGLRAELIASPSAEAVDLERAHDAAYVAAVDDGTLGAAQQRRIGLPWSPVLARRARAVVGGTLAAARSALEQGLSGQLAGGTHHAHRAHGAGFCVFNDIAVAALTLLAERVVQRIAVLDLDVHQGDGNASLLAANPDVLVVSVHGANNFPFHKVPSDLDIALPDGTEDGPYLAVLGPALERVEAFRPDLMLYLSGADPIASDTLGRLSLTLPGLQARDRAVFAFCRRKVLPVAFALGGGYARPIEDTIAGYAGTVAAALESVR